MGRGPGCGLVSKRSAERERRLASCVVCLVAFLGAIGVQSAYARPAQPRRALLARPPRALRNHLPRRPQRLAVRPAPRPARRSSTPARRSSTPARRALHTSTTVRAKSTTTTTEPPPPLPPGYWVVRADGTVENFGTASLGDLGEHKAQPADRDCRRDPWWARLLARGLERWCFLLRERHVPWLAGWAQAQQPNSGDRPNTRRWRLLARRRRRWDFQLRGCPVLRFNGGKAPERADSWDSRDARWGRVLARGNRRRHFRLRGRPVLRVDRVRPSQ